MTLFDAVMLLIIMLLLALTSSTSVALVVSRSASAGVGNGIAVSASICLLVKLCLADSKQSFERIHYQAKLGSEKVAPKKPLMAS
jgi:hypothetical protein